MARSKKAINYQNIDALDIIAMQDSFCTSTMNYSAEIERLLKLVEETKAKQRSAEAEFEASHTKAIQSYFNKFLTELKLGFADRALIFGAILHVKAETETNPQSDLILACYTRYDDYVQDSSNKWIDKDYLPKEA